MQDRVSTRGVQHGVEVHVHETRRRHRGCKDCHVHPEARRPDRIGRDERAKSRPRGGARKFPFHSIRPLSYEKRGDERVDAEAERRGERSEQNSHPPRLPASAWRFPCSSQTRPLRLPGWAVNADGWWPHRDRTEVGEDAPAGAIEFIFVRMGNVSPSWAAGKWARISPSSTDRGTVLGCPGHRRDRRPRRLVWVTDQLRPRRRGPHVVGDKDLGIRARDDRPGRLIEPPGRTPLGHPS